MLIKKDYNICFFSVWRDKKLLSLCMYTLNFSSMCTVIVAVIFVSMVLYITPVAVTYLMNG